MTDHIYLSKVPPLSHDDNDRDTDMELRIYAASLADYNAGRLHGTWIVCEGKDADDLQGEVSAMLADSPEPIAEEYAIHDHEGFGDLVGEYTGLAEVAAIVAALESADDAGALLEYADAFGYGITEAADHFEDSYSGQWDSERDFAENLLDDLGELDDGSLLAQYFDYDAFTRDLFLSDYTRTAGGYVFRNDA